MASKLVLFCGPSGAGKSTVIRALARKDESFEYVKPVTTRHLRDGEADKTHVSLEKMDKMMRAGALLMRNTIYGHDYGTPRTPIDKMLREGRFPCLDWPISRLDLMTQAYPGRVFCIYVAPPSLKTLRLRLQQDGRDPSGLRWEAAQAEMAAFIRFEYADAIDLAVVSQDGQTGTMTDVIRASVLASPAPVRNPCMFGHGTGE